MAAGNPFPLHQRLQIVGLYLIFRAVRQRQSTGLKEENTEMENAQQMQDA